MRMKPELQAVTSARLLTPPPVLIGTAHSLAWLVLGEGPGSMAQGPCQAQ